MSLPKLVRGHLALLRGDCGRYSSRLGPLPVSGQAASVRTGMALSLALLCASDKLSVL